MAKIRHIAIRARDTEAMAKFFQEAFGMELAHRRERGAIDLSDGDVNITLLPIIVNTADQDMRPGIEHIGFTVEDTAATRRKLLAQGATEMNPNHQGQAFFELKFQGPEGLIVDVGHWRGTSPITREQAGGVTTEWRILTTG